MSQALTAAARLKPEIRLAQAVSEFEADLSGEQKAAFRTNKAKTIQSSPNTQDVMRLAAEIDRVSGRNGRCLGPRLMNLLQAVQKFAALGDVVVGGSQNLIACGIWTIVRTSLELLTKFSSCLEKLSVLFMKVGRSAPRFESMALLYPRSRDLQSSLCEYFIVVVHLCHEILQFTRKSNLKKFASSLSDSNLTQYQSDLESWGSTIKEEVGLLMAARIEKEANMNSKLRDVSSKFFGITSNQQKVQARQRVLDICTNFDHMVVWKQIRKAGNTNIFRQCPHYQRWKSTTTSNSLVYTGKLGAGKSVLLANIVENLHLQVQDEVIPVAFFFSRHDVSESLKAQTVLGSIARQLLERVSDLTEPAELLGRVNNMGPPEKVFALLQSAFPQGYKVFIVIDGIDELGREERELLIRHLHTLQRMFVVSLCVSLREDANDPLKIGSEQLSTVTITSIPENTSDIELFISQELQRCIESKRLIVGDISLLLEIQETLTKFSDGMFLWVALQIESLCAMETDEAISRALKDLPKGLSETFGRILQRSQRLGHSYQKSILELVTVAQRPLTLEELREALSVAPGDTKWNPARLLNNIHSTLACCGSLVIIDEEELTLRLVHHSVKQYLLLEFKDPASGPITIVDAHARMSDIIVTYLSYSDYDRQLSKAIIPEIKTDETMNGIVRSTRYSLDYMSGLALKLLRSRNDSNFNMGKTLAAARAARFRSRDHFFFRDYAMLCWQSHISRSLPLGPKSSSLFERLCERKALDPVTMTDDEASFLLFRAAETGNLFAVRYIISSKPRLDVNKKMNHHGQTALHVATWHGAEATARFLFTWGSTDISSTDLEKNTALDLAIRRGHVSIVNAFLSHYPRHPTMTDLVIESLRHHLEITSNFNFDVISEVLLVAARNGNDTLIGMILHDRRVQLVLKRRIWRAIHAAVSGGQYSIVNELLAYSKIPRLMDYEIQLGYDSLQQAVKIGDRRIVKSLVESGMLDVDSINQDGLTALHIATELNNLEMVKLLLLHSNASLVYVTGGQNQTPLQTALFSGHDEAAKLMVQHVLSGTATNSSIDTGDLSKLGGEAKCIYTPFHYAAEKGDASMASSLLKLDANLVHRLDHEGRTPLHLAALKGHLHIVNLIRAIEGVDLFSIDDQGYSPRDYAMQSGNTPIARLMS
ncbi:NACHT nucleoside triphosphatase [Penicillium hordei]|uniref:NACHT nucleoside triphosphatase n=1 Tax=Penicillium hordei TaxID=40994 RepID=A0AAD6H6A0_9EURO|nr:NACHT nucleoside triphosphatase [Penicillium hordei]KAJ5616636.1 NACHT nucleoside triphosphatase [Penicillium hordei]